MAVVGGIAVGAVPPGGGPPPPSPPGVGLGVGDDGRGVDGADRGGLPSSSTSDNDIK